MINFALIGIGEWGKNYLSTIKAFPDCRIKYLCSLNSANLQQYKKNYITTTNFKDLFKFQDIDGVIIATSGSEHYKIAKQFLERGFNLLIEKPLVTKYSDSLKLKELKNKTNSKILVGHIYLFDPAYIKTKELLKDIGSIKFISYEAENNGPFRADMSILWDLGPHAISLILDVYDKTPYQVIAWGLKNLRPKLQLFDLVTLRLKFSDQNDAFIKLSWLYPIKRRELVIVGSKSTLVYNDLLPNRVTLFENMGPDIIGKDLIKKLPNIKYPTYEHRLPLEVEIGEFIEAIKRNQDIYRSNLDFGIKVTKILHLAEQSIKNEGKAVNVDF